MRRKERRWGNIGFAERFPEVSQSKNKVCFICVNEAYFFVLFVLRLHLHTSTVYNL